MCFYRILMSLARAPESSEGNNGLDLFRDHCCRDVWRLRLAPLAFSRRRLSFSHDSIIKTSHLVWQLHSSMILAIDLTKASPVHGATTIVYPCHMNDCTTWSERATGDPAVLAHTNG